MVDSMITPNTPTSSDAHIISGDDLYLEGLEESDAVDILSRPIPDKVPDNEIAESFLTRSISAMTPTDREDAYYDIHAIHDDRPEDPEEVNKSLDLLEEEIMIREDNEAYLQAKSSNPDYVQNRDFRLMFLRTDRFDEKKAALRMVRHFEMKLDLFGKERLGRDITQDDMNIQDMGSLTQGNCQLLPTKDRGGRVIMCFTADGASLKSRMRRLFYLLMLALRDPETQKRGLVAVVSYIKNKDESAKAGGFTGAWKVPKLILGIPIYVAAVHLAYDSMRWAPVHAILRVALSMFTRVRFRAFYGTIEEWLCSMKSFGIQPDQLPFKIDGSIDNSVNKKFLETHRRKERMTYPERSRVGVPGPYDVLFGKGSRFQNHIGNVKFRAFIADCKKTYEKTKRGEKHILVQEIVDTVKQSSGLFLKADDEGWIVVDDAAAAYKVGAVFRTLRTLEDRH